MGGNPSARSTARDTLGHPARGPVLGLVLWVTVAIALMIFPVWLALLLSVPLD